VRFKVLANAANATVVEAMSSSTPNEHEFATPLRAQPDCVPPDREMPVIESTRDEELIQHLRVRDAAGFAMFFDQYARRLFAMTWCILRDLKDAEEALETAFLWIWNHPFAFDSKRGRSFYSWALLAARSAALERLFHRSTGDRPRQCSNDKLLRSAPGPRRWADEVAIQEGERRRVDAALSLLSQPQRRTLELAFFAAMTDQEISRAFATPLIDVRMIIRDGLITLREHLLRVTTSTALLRPQSD